MTMATRVAGAVVLVPAPSVLAAALEVPKAKRAVWTMVAPWLLGEKQT
jgi:hypothetical protein